MSKAGYQAANAAANGAAGTPAAHGNSGGSSTLAQRIAQVPPHSAITAADRSLVITLDFRPTQMLHHAKWFEPAGKAFRTTLETSIAGYSQISRRIFIKVDFPAFDARTQFEQVRIRQKAFMTRIIDLLNTFHKTEKIEVVYRSPGTGWLQIRCLAPLYGLTFTDWELSIREGQDPLQPIGRDTYWDKRLRGLCNGPESEPQ